MTQRARSGKGEKNPVYWPPGSDRNYRRLLLFAVLSVGLVSLVPLVIMAAVNYVQYRQAFRTELRRPVIRMTGTAKSSMEFFLLERQSALELIVLEESLELLSDPEHLSRLLSNMSQSFGGFIDLGLIGPDGRHISYAGPYNLQEANYAGEDWYQEVGARGAYTSDVFLGIRDVPHFVIALRHDTPGGNSYVLRATIDTEAINQQILRRGDRPFADIFLINRQGVLQTPSRLFGGVLEPLPLRIPPSDDSISVFEAQDPSGEPLIVGAARIDRSPFTVLLVSRGVDLGEGWLSLRRNLLVFLVVSVTLILIVVVYGSKSMINRIRESDIRRAALFHEMEYTNKMAAIGRLASGVAHEINNPLAIINEKAGLAKDLLTFSDQLPPKEKLIDLIDSTLYSVERCSRITHRLLGFAKQVDVHHEWIDIRDLLEEVLGFLGREAEYRNLFVSRDFPEDLPLLYSDLGQLQQVFLNILNNAFAAVDDGGEIHISAGTVDDEIAVRIMDNGVGIPQDALAHIFEPFFSTKGTRGTGLGLSITYGIVTKLGGKIDVQSTVGEGTRFTVTLPAGT